MPSRKKKFLTDPEQQRQNKIVQFPSPPAPPQPDLQRWLNVQQAAQYMSGTLWHVRALIRDGKIPFVKVGKRFVVDRNDLDSYLAGAKTKVA